VTGHERLAEDTGIKAYFAVPHNPWQRGINENTHDLLHQYLPKGTDMSVLTQKELNQISWNLIAAPVF